MSGGYYVKSYVNTEEKSVDDLEEELKKTSEAQKSPGKSVGTNLYTELDSIFR